MTPLPLRRNHGFRMLWIGQVLSDTGSDAAFIAYPLLILALTGSPAIAGVVGTARLVVQLLLGLPGGTLADRLDRRLTMIVCDTTRVVVLALLAVLVLLHVVTWPVVLIVAVVDGAANVVFNPAATAALPAIVADEQLEQAWAATEARTYAASLAGPALGGALFGLGRSLPFIADSVSYLVSAITVSRIRGRFRPEQVGERASWWRETADGVRTVWQHPLLRAVVIQAPLINFAFNGVIFAITVALRRYGTAPGVVGLVQAGIAVGGLLGALAATRLQGRLPLSQVAVVLTVMATALFAAGAAILPSTFVAVPVAVALMLGPTANAALFAAMLRAAPEGMRGRVNNTVLLAATALAALSPLVAGLLLEHLSGRWTLLAFAAVMAVAAVLAIVL
ncbi:MAG: MFS transporter, partial [Actinobacteria bacterium]|nr:MFS transporter [Actinomycetota bacterium]